MKGVKKIVISKAYACLFMTEPTTEKNPKPRTFMIRGTILYMQHSVDLRNAAVYFPTCNDAFYV